MQASTRNLLKYGTTTIADASRPLLLPWCNKATPVFIDVLVGFLCLTIYFVLLKWSRKDYLPLPPGPQGFPLIGNLLDVPQNSKWLKFHEWSKEFDSDILYLNMGGKDVIILDSWEAAWELLEKRSSIYSDRPRMRLLNELVGLDYVFALRQYDEQWRSQRSLMHHAFHPVASELFHPHIFKSVQNLLRRILQKPEDIVGNLRHMAGETILSITYGLEVQPNDDPYIELAEQCTRCINEAAIPGAYLVDAFPILRYVPGWMPGAGFQKKIKRWRDLGQAMFDQPFRAAKTSIDSGTSMPSFVKHCYDNINEDYNLIWQEYLIQGTAATLYMAGADTTVSSIAFCIVALLKHPDVLQRAQQEIDSVIHHGELPTFQDEEKLPFVSAICLETMRWKDTAPTALPHRLTTDDTYKGYRLPKGSIVIPNAWAMLHNEEIYPDPFSFKPDRFMKDGKINNEVRHPARAAFGFGRRICPGRFMAHSAVWITIASILTAFDIAKAVDVNGEVVEIDIDDEFTEGVVRKPKSFLCSMKPRSDKHENAILSATLDEAVLVRQDM